MTDLSEIGSFRKAFEEVLIEVGEVLKNLIVIDSDVSHSTYTIEFFKRFPSRFVQVGISEQDAAGTAAGLALAGKIPILTAFSMFIMRSWEQIRNTIARDNLNVKIVGTHAGLSDYLDGPSHQCLEDIALMRILPNITVVAPSDEVSTKSLFRQILDFRGPTYFRLGRDNAYKVYDEEDDVELYKCNILVDGEDITIISYGALVSISIKAADILRKKGYSVRVIDSHTIKPLDVNMILKAARETMAIFAVEEHSIYGGLGSEITEIVSEKNPMRIYRIGVDDVFGANARSYEDLLDYFSLTSQKITSRIEMVLNEF